MTTPKQIRRYRFGVFEADAATGELRRQGVRIKVNVQPFQVLLMLLERPGELLTREEISRELWPDGTFVDYEHGVNSAVNRIREALGDKARTPRFIETLARRGYRFVAPVQQVADDGELTPIATPSTVTPSSAITGEPNPSLPEPESQFSSRFLANSDELPRTSHRTVQTLFALLQLMYVAFYVGALANLAEIEDIFSGLPRSAEVTILLVVTAALLIPVRAFLLCAVLLHAPRVREKILKIWPFLLPFDELWALSPFLLLHHISFGLALSCTALLAYSPFAQRSLVLMGAGERSPELSSAS
jgi:cholera toxin transcriptional activator